MCSYAPYSYTIYCLTSSTCYSNAATIHFIQVSSVIEMVLDGQFLLHFMNQILDSGHNS